MKLGPVTKIEERNTTMLKEFKDYAWPVKLTFSLIGTFYHTKTENKTKKCLTQLP